LTKIKQSTDSEVSWKEKLLAKEMGFIKLEMDVKKATKGMEKALKTLNEIDQQKLDFYYQSTSEVKQLSGVIEAIAKSFLKTLCHTFDISEISDDSIESPEGQVLHIGLKKYLYQESGENEIQFLGEKINEYRENSLKKKAEIEAANAHSRLYRHNMNPLVMTVVNENMPVENVAKDLGLESVTSNKLVVELDQIPNPVIQKFRHDLSINLLEEFQELRLKLSEDFDTKISEIVRRLTHNRHSEIQDLEIRTAEIHDICRERIDEIDRLNVRYENEAAIIARRLQIIREDYKESTELIEDNCSKFISKIQSELLKEVWTAKTPADMDFLIKDFQILSDAHLARMRKMVSKAQKKFDQGRKAMANSQVPQKHAQAWKILSERGYHPEREIYDLDDFKDEFFSRQGSSVNHLIETIDQTLTEMQLHWDDLRFLEKVNRNLNDFKMKTLGRVV
jgi:hypothetical protein